jgi:hypothetical protein
LIYSDREAFAFSANTFNRRRTGEGFEEGFDSLREEGENHPDDGTL